MTSVSTTSRKRFPSPDHESRIKPRRDGPSHRTYENINNEGHSSSHFGDRSQYIEYNGPVHQYLTPIQHTEPRTSRPAKRSEILECLKFDSMNDRYSNIKSTHAKTCQWLLEREEYVNWRDDKMRKEHNGFLWIKGKPGAGKSTLMKFAFQRAKDCPGNRTLASFFFNARGGELERSTEGMYRSLIAQILEGIPRLQTVLDAQRPRDEWPVETLSELFRQIIASLGGDHLTCYVDALDECSLAEVRDMTELFQELTDSAEAACNGLRVCFSSRHYPQIRMRTCQEITLEAQTGHGEDIATYIKGKLKGPTRLKSDLTIEIERRASGIFLWVCLVVGILNTDIDGGQVHMVRARLREIPDGLHDLLQAIIARETQKNNHIIPTLQLIMFAKRLLSPEELYNAIMYTYDDSFETMSNRERFEMIQRFLLDSSKGLAEITKGAQPTVQFIHESVRDYLCDTGFQTLAPGLGKNVPGITHDNLKQRCHSFITDRMCDQLSLPEPLPDAKSETIRVIRAKATQSFPFLEYAISNILCHAEDACKSEVSQDSFIDTFPILTWSILSNLFEKHTIRRYTTNVSKVYLFAERGAPRLLSIELEKFGPSFSRTKERHRTPLCAAVYGGNTDVVAMILRYGAMAAYLHAEQKKCFRMAVEKRSRVMLSLLKGNVGVPVSSKALETIFCEYSLTGNSEAVHFLIKHGIDVNAERTEYGNALKAACYQGHFKLANTLLENCAQVNAQGGKYGQALQALCTGRILSIDMLRKLLEHGADVNAQGRKYGNALQAACANCGASDDAVQVLLESGANVNAQGGKYGNALQAACFGCSTKTVQVLLDNGADVNAEGGEYSNALQMACYRGSRTKVQILLGNNADVNVQGGEYGNALQAACATDKDSDKIVHMLLERGVRVNAQGGKYSNALYAACVKSSAKTVQILLEAGADVNSQAGEYGNALQAACTRDKDSDKIVHMLLERGVRVNAQGGKYGNALQAAVNRCSDTTVQMLLTKGADVNAQGGEYGNALQAASYRGSRKMIRILLDHGASIDAQGGKFDSALQAACAGYKDSSKTAQLLLAYGADPNAQGGKYGDALKAACSQNSAKTVRILLDNGANANAQGGEYGNALQAACASW
jgi:ankyrin repeat protein